VANWDYAALPKVLTPGRESRSFIAATAEDLKRALDASHDSLVFIEARMTPQDAPLSLILRRPRRGPLLRPATAAAPAREPDR